MTATTTRREISAKTERDLQKFDKRRDELNRLLAAIPAQMAAIEQAQRERAMLLATARETAEMLTQAHEHANNFALYALETSGEQEAVSRLNAAEQAMNEARFHLTQVEADTAAADDAAAIQLAQLQNERDQAQRDLAEVARLTAIAEDVRHRVLSELGMQEYETLARELQSHHAHIEQARQEVVSRQQALHRFIEKAASQLAAWPDLQSAIVGEVVVSDATTELLESGVAFYGALLSNGPQVALTDQMYRRAGKYTTSLSDVLWLEPAHILQALIGKNPATVRERKQALEILLSVYRQSKTERG